NGVEVREVDVSHSFAQNTLEDRGGKYCAVRLGFRQIDGFSWKDEDEERLKQIQSSFRGASVGELLPQARSTSPQRGEVGLRSNPGEGAQVPRESVTPHPALRADLSQGGGVAPPMPQSGEILVDDWAARIVAARKRR